MARVVYVGLEDEVDTAATGIVARGIPVEVDDDAAGGLVGYGDGVWRYVDERDELVDPVDTSEPTPDPEPVPVSAPKNAGDDAGDDEPQED